MSREKHMAGLRTSEAEEHERRRRGEQAARLEEASRKLPRVPYLRDDPGAQVLETSSSLALPFPPSIVAPLPGSEYLLEQVTGKWYLRSLAISHFCRPVYTTSRVFSQEDLGSTGVPWICDFRATLLSVTHLGKEYCVGYYATHSKPPVTFLPAFASTASLDELPAVQAVLYMAANTLHRLDESGQSFQMRLLGKYDSGLARPELVFDAVLSTRRQQAAKRAKHEHGAYATGTHPVPKGPWEAGLFNDAFGGDPGLMSDAEYEMVFGQGR